MDREPDLVPWIWELGVDVPWEYDLLEAFVHAYLRANVRRRADTRRALPGIDAEAAIWRALRSRCRRN
jgi:hypothetical protein